MINIVYSQGPYINEEWNEISGSQPVNNGWSVFQSNDGNYVVIGETSRSWEENFDILFMKVDKNGKILKEIPFGGPQDNWFHCAAKTLDGNYILVCDYRLIKVDPSGKILWDRTPGNLPLSRSIRATKDGGYIVIGEKSSQIFLVKVDSNGVLQWERPYGGAGSRGWSVVQTSDNGYLISGDVWETSHYKEFMIRTDINGDVLWDRDGMAGGHVEETSDGGFIMTSYDKLIKTDSEGVVVWKEDPGTSIRGVREIENGYVVLGLNWLTITDLNGKTLLSKSLSNPVGYSSAVKSLDITNDGGLIVVGDSDAQDGSNNRKVWLIKVGPIYDQKCNKIGDLNIEDLERDLGIVSGRHDCFFKDRFQLLILNESTDEKIYPLVPKVKLILYDNLNHIFSDDSETAKKMYEEYYLRENKDKIADKFVGKGNLIKLTTEYLYYRYLDYSSLPQFADEYSKGIILELINKLISSALNPLGFLWDILNYLDSILHVFELLDIADHSFGDFESIITTENNRIDELYKISIRNDDLPYFAIPLIDNWNIGNSINYYFAPISYKWGKKPPLEHRNYNEVIMSLEGWFQPLEYISYCYGDVAKGVWLNKNNGEYLQEKDLGTSIEDFRENPTPENYKDAWIKSVKWADDIRILYILESVILSQKGTRSLGVESITSTPPYPYSEGWYDTKVRWTSYLDSRYYDEDTWANFLKESVHRDGVDLIEKSVQSSKSASEWTQLVLSSIINEYVIFKQNILDSSRLINPENPPGVCRDSWNKYILHSNADLHVYDPLGRHIGIDYITGNIQVSVPGSTYTANEIQEIRVPDLEEGNYRIELVGKSNGSYEIEIMGGQGETTLISESYTGIISKGQVHDAIVEVSIDAGVVFSIKPPVPRDPQNQFPIPAFNLENEWPVAGTLTEFNASKSFDPDGSITNYSWDFGDGYKGIGESANHLFMSSGSYRVTLTVVDDKNAESSLKKSINVTDLSAGFRANIIASKTKAIPGEIVEFNISIKNIGEAIICPTLVECTIPSGLTYKKDSWNTSIIDEKVTWAYYRQLNPRESLQIYLECTVDKDTSEDIETSVDVSGIKLNGNIGLVNNSAGAKITILKPGIKVEKSLGLSEPVQYGQFCGDLIITGRGDVDVSTNIVDKKLALKYSNSMAGNGDIEIESENALSESAGKLQRPIGNNTTSLNLYENIKMSYLGETPLSGGKYLESNEFFGGIGASIQEAFSVNEMEKDQQTFFASTDPTGNEIDQNKSDQLRNASSTHLVALETKNSFNGTWGTDAYWHKIFYKDINAHEMFTGTFEADKLIKFHENPVPEKEHNACEGIDC